MIYVSNDNKIMLNNMLYDIIILGEVMESLISINHKFMGLTPKRLVELILESKYTNGVEAYIDVANDNELKYLDDLVFELKKNNLILQIHGEIELDYDKQLEFMKTLEKYSDYLEIPIVLTLHTVLNDDDEISIKQTIEYTSNLINSVDSNKIIICLENLNDSRGFIRLGKEEIRSTVLNDEKLYFTYDIGHEIADYGKITDLDEYMIEDIRNVHLHSNDGKGNDHFPIYKNDLHWNEIIKGLTFLRVNNYKYNIVYEYALEYCRGETTEEKVKDYLYSMDYVSEKYGCSVHE